LGEGVSTFESSEDAPLTQPNLLHA
jgi:hypothetical protein